MAAVIAVQRAEDAVHLALLALGDRMDVDIAVHIAVEIVEQLLHLRRHLQHALCAVLHKVRDKGVDALAVALAAAAADALRHLVGGEQPRADRVVEVVVDVGDAVAQAHDRGLARVVGRAVRVMEDAHARLKAEIQSLPVALEDVHDTQALLIVLEAAGIDLVQRPFARMAEGRVAQIVAQRRSFRQVLVEAKRPRNGARETRDLERMSQPRAVMVALRLEEDLRFML